jgi:hypothetical protein
VGPDVLTSIHARTTKAGRHSGWRTKSVPSITCVTPGTRTKGSWISVHGDAQERQRESEVCSLKHAIRARGRYRVPCPPRTIAAFNRKWQHGRPRLFASATALPRTLRGRGGRGLLISHVGRAWAVSVRLTPDAACHVCDQIIKSSWRL